MLLFASDLQSQTISQLRLIGLHRTKPQIIYRELGFEPGRPLAYSDSMKQIWQQRLQTSKLFNQVDIQPYDGGDTLTIDFLERWYYWVQPEGGFADRNFHSWWKNRELSRLWMGGTLRVNNLLGEQKGLIFRAVLGYNQAFGLGVSLPFLKSRHCNSWLVFWENQKNHEMGVNSIQNQWQFHRLNDGFVQDLSQLRIEWKRRFEFHQQLAVQLKLQRFGVDTSAWLINPDLMLKDARLEMANQKGLLNQNSITLRVGGVRDTRNFIHYPTSGSEWKYGAMVYLQSMNGPMRNAFELESRYRKFHSISSRTSWAWMVLGRYRMGEVTYPLMRQMGYGMDYVRGFESQVMDGNGLILSKLAYRYALLPNNAKMKLRILPKAYEKIPIQAWFNIFADVGRVLQPYQPNLNPLGNQTLGSVGVGCDALIYYDALVRTDLSFNPNFKRWVFNLTFYHAL